VEVVPTSLSVCKDWLIKKHYLHRLPTIKYAFALIISTKVEGVCVFSPAVARFDLSVSPIELSRLIINENLPKNTLSRFLSMALKAIQNPHVVVSYADQSFGHTGYIYQATNWIYTGTSSAEAKIFINGEELHRRTIYERYGTSSIPKLKEMGLLVEEFAQLGKHRYFQFTGSKKDRMNLKREISEKYPILPYPKGNNTRYDVGEELNQIIKIGTFF
jgi:hypothetical protein